MGDSNVVHLFLRITLYGLPFEAPLPHSPPPFPINLLSPFILTAPPLPFILARQLSSHLS